MKKTQFLKKFWIPLLVTVLLAIGASLLYSRGYFAKPAPQPAVKTEVQGQPTLDEVPGQQKKYTDEQIRLYQQYLKDAIPLVAAGDNGDPSAYRKAIALYQKAADISGQSVWVPYLNLGNIYRKVKEYGKAEAAYDKALAISGYGADQVYIGKIDLYRYDLKKSDAEIDKLYEEAMGKVVENINLALRYATFLRDTGQFAKAVQYYEVLVKRFPDNAAYKQELDSAKAKAGIK